MNEYPIEMTPEEINAQTVELKKAGEALEAARGRVRNAISVSQQLISAAEIVLTLTGHPEAAAPGELLKLALRKAGEKA